MERGHQWVLAGWGHSLPLEQTETLVISRFQSFIQQVLQRTRQGIKVLEAGEEILVWNGVKPGLHVSAHPHSSQAEQEVLDRY